MPEFGHVDHDASRLLSSVGGDEKDEFRFDPAVPGDAPSTGRERLRVAHPFDGRPSAESRSAHAPGPSRAIKTAGGATTLAGDDLISWGAGSMAADDSRQAGEQRSKPQAVAVATAAPC
jgi:hypothetical protein